MPHSLGNIKGTTVLLFPSYAVMNALLATECVSHNGKKACQDIGGTCHIERDGYYVVTGICLAVGLIILLTFIIPTARRLQGTLHLIHLSFLDYCPSAPDFCLANKNVTS